MEKDYREKIKKLLALAESPNEHEAKAALLKAKELMAEHKLSELDVKDTGKKEVKEVLLEGMQASTRHNPWIIPLSTVIGENYCCNERSLCQCGTVLYPKMEYIAPGKTDTSKDR